MLIQCCSPNLTCMGLDRTYPVPAQVGYYRLGK